MTFKEIFFELFPSIEFTHLREPLLIKHNCKNALSRTRGYLSHGKYMDFTLNPYYGCAFSCNYCYVPKSFAFIHGKLGNVNWGKWIVAKTNIHIILEEELKKLENKDLLNSSVIRISSISDCYQPIEKDQKLMQKILSIFNDYRPKLVYIQTKSTLIERDIHLLSKIKENLILSFTLSTNLEKIRKIFEPKVPSIQERVNLIRKFYENGFKVDILIAPTLPMEYSKFAHLVKGIAHRYILKSFFDDGKNGKNIRSNTFRILKEKNWDLDFFTEIQKKCFFTLRKTLGEDKVFKGKEDFVNLNFFNNIKLS